MATNQILTPEELGSIAKFYAPDVPLEVIGAVFQKESSLGRNVAAYTPLDTGTGKQVNGPGQITISPGTYQKGDPRSLFEAYFPANELREKANPNNPTHLAIAAVRKMNDDWQKGKGDIREFVGNYFGRGAADKFGTTGSQYTKDLVKYIRAGATDPAFASFLKGAEDTQTNLASGNRGAKADLSKYGETEDENVIDELDTKFQTARLSEISYNTKNLVRATEEVAKATKNELVTKANTATAISDGAKKVAALMGFDFEDKLSTVYQAAEFQQNAIKQQVAAETALQKTYNDNPIFKVLDNLSGNLATSTIRKEYQDRATVAANVGKSLDQLANNVANAMNIKKATLSQYTMEEAIAAKYTVAAKASYDIANLESGASTARYGVENDIYRTKVDTATREDNKKRQVFLDELKSEQLRAEFFKLEAANEKAKLQLELTEAKIADMEGKGEKRTAEMDKLLVETQAKKLETDTKIAKMQSLNNWAKQLNTEPAKLLNDSDKDSLLRRVLEDDVKNPSYATLAYLSANAKLTEEQAIRFKAHFGPNGHFPNLSAQINQQMIAEKIAKPEDRFVRANQIAVETAQQKQSIILNGDKSNPYAGEHALLLSLPKESAMYQNPNVVRARTIANNAGIKSGMDEAEVLNTLTAFAKKNSDSPAQQAMVVSSYYKGLVDLNNFGKKFGDVGLPTQSTYPVPIAKDSTGAFSLMLEAGAYSLGGGFTLPFFSPSKGLGANKPFKVSSLNKEANPNNPQVLPPVIDLADETQLTNLLLYGAIGKR